MAFPRAPFGTPSRFRGLHPRPPEKPKCEEGFIETVTQTSWMGSKNEWEVQHVIFNDTAIIEAGIDTTTVNLDAFSSHILARRRLTCVALGGQPDVR